VKNNQMKVSKAGTEATELSESQVTLISLLHILKRNLGPGMPLYLQTPFLLQIKMGKVKKHKVAFLRCLLLF
jgi:hypothetical protein